MSTATPTRQAVRFLPTLPWFLLGSLFFLLPLLTVPWLARSDTEARWLAGGLRGQTVTALSTVGSTGASILYGETATGLWRSVDGGRTWQRISRPLPSGAMGSVNLVAWDAPSRLYAIVTERGAPRLYISQDGGQSWDEVLSSDAIPKPVRSIVATEEGEVGLATPTGFYWSGDEGVQWQHRADWPQGVEPSHLYFTAQGTLLAHLRGGGLLLSLDRGTIWRPVGPEDTVVLAAAGSRLYAAGRSSMARSDDGGRTWQPLTQPGKRVAGLAADPLVTDKVYAVLSGGALFSSDDGGEAWRLVTRSLGQSPLALAIDATTRDWLYAALSDGVWRIQIVPPAIPPTPTPTTTDTPTLTTTPSLTPTHTPMATATLTPSPTWTPAPPTATPTAAPTTLSPTETLPPPTDTPLPPPPTPRPPSHTKTPVPPTDTPTSPPPTNTPTPIPPPTNTPTPMPPPDTPTPVPPTSTPTPMPPPDTPTPVPPTSTPTPLPPPDTPTPITPPPPR